MLRIGLLLSQSALSIAPPPASDQRLLHPVPPSTCHPAPNEILVCGRDADAYRLPKTGPAPETAGLPKAEWRLFGNARMDVHAEQRSLPQGASAPAAMVTIKLPF